MSVCTKLYICMCVHVYETVCITICIDETVYAMHVQNCVTCIYMFVTIMYIIVCMLVRVCVHVYKTVGIYKTIH